MKNVSAGYASLNYREAGYATDDLVKVELALNGARVRAVVGWVLRVCGFVLHVDGAVLAQRCVRL